MKVYIDQIPEDASFEDYPAGTEFIFDEPSLQRDPITHELLPGTKRPLIYPKDIK